MIEGRGGGGSFYKTKLCALYQKGHCSRSNCNYAHGEKDLRTGGVGSMGSRSHHASSNGTQVRRDYRGSDLRDKLHRRNSPPSRYSQGRDERPRDISHGRNSSHSPERKGYRRQESRHHSDSADGSKERKVKSSYAKDNLEQQLKQLQLDIQVLDNNKCQREIYLEKCVQEVKALTFRNEELEVQIAKEKEIHKRASSKIKKFVKAHKRYSRAQENLKRSQARLQRMGDQLVSDGIKHSVIDEDSSVNVSDREPNCCSAMSPGREVKNQLSLGKKRSYASVLADGDAKAGYQGKGLLGRARLEKVARLEGPATIFESKSKEADALSVDVVTGSNGHMSVSNEERQEWTRSSSLSTASVEKVKVFDQGHMRLPSNSDAHFVDQFVDVVELDEKIEGANYKASSIAEKRVEKTSYLYLPPPPPGPPPNAYNKVGHNQYANEEEILDIEG